VRNDNSVHTYTAGTNFTNAFLFGNFPEKWDESKTVRFIHPIEIAPQLNVSLGYTATDGGERVFCPLFLFRVSALNWKLLRSGKK